MFAFEQPAESLEDAAAKSRTGFYWYIYGDNDYQNFDFDFVPLPWESTHVHVWPTQWNQYGGAYLAHSDSVTEYKWQFHNQIVKTKPDQSLFYSNYEINSFDYTWRPHPMDPPYIYVFGNNWYPAECMPTIEYRVPGATERKFMSEPHATLPQRHDNHWHTLIDCDWDYSWVPDPGDPPYIYVFGNQHWSATAMPTVKYTVPGATEIKYMDYPQAKLFPDCNNWYIPDNVTDVDTSWVPDPGDPAYIYHFPSQHQSSCGVNYTVPGATEIKLTNGIQCRALPTQINWSVPEEINTDTVDLSWHPNPLDPPYVYHFGTDYQQSVGLTYTVPGATELKFAGPIPVKGEQTDIGQRAVVVLDIFYIDRGNDTATVRFEKLQARYPGITKLRYANSMMDTVRRCVTRTGTTKFWIISSEYDYTNFDFAWHAEPWQNYMTHVFPSQHQKWSDTFLINRHEFERHSQWANNLEEFPNLNFVANQTVIKPDNTYNIYYVDHGNPGSITQYEMLRDCSTVDVVRTRFVDNYLDTFKRIMSTATTEYIWIINSICDYAEFDFTWEPEPWQREMIHVFPSGFQKRGDTFRIHVESFKKQMIELEMLDWFNVINYCKDQTVHRRPTPIHRYYTDDLVTEIKNYNFDFPYALFTNQSNLHLNGTTCLWSAKDRVVSRISKSGASVMVPRDIKASLRTQIYDYPYVEESQIMVNDYLNEGRFPQLDIVFISNGEPDEEKWYEHTCYASNSDVKWVRGINGRVAAYQEAARQSETPWFFAVFAKLEVLGGSFDWFWMPDYFQEPKHYIFNALNPVNGLEYGHMGMIAYNKNLVLANNTPGIDFTLTQPHESVPISSGTAYYNQDAWTTWRTAFREVVKLKHSMATAPTVETEYRLRVWCDENSLKFVEFAEWSIRGARDAVRYYDEVAGDYELLKLSFEWDWLRERFIAISV